MKNIKCLLTYCGTNYLGFQKTSYGPSVEEELQKALEKILQYPVKLQVASRTDKGVHAKGQVCNFFLKKEIPFAKLYTSLNSLLPKDISLLHLEPMPTSFHSTLDAKKKEYGYFLCNSYTQLPFHREFSWHVPFPLQIDFIRKGSEIFIGTHDFSAFSNRHSTYPICTIENIRIKSFPKNRYLIIFTGNHFLYKMIRNIVGTLVYVGLNKISLSDLPIILKNRKKAPRGLTAPACGLCLKKIFY